MPFQAPLKAQDLTKYFGPHVAVNSISFELKPKEILGFLGTNGAGKTTTIQMLLSTMTPSSGTITYFGKNFFEHRSEILQHVSFASTYVRLPGKLTVYENLDFYAEIYGLSLNERRALLEKFLKFFDMWRLRDRRAGNLSAGEMTRAMLAKAFLVKPKIVLLDEPTASLDPDIAHAMRDFILEQRRENDIAILFTSHNMAEVAAVCDRVLILKEGTIIADNSPTQLAASVSQIKVQLIIQQQTEKAVQIAQQYSQHYSLDQSLFEIELDEQTIAKFLAALAQANIHYSAITIKKPTLEDYFLSIALKSHKSKE